MTKPKQKIPASQPDEPDALFGRVVSILEQAQSNVVRAVNTNMVLAYWWLIGREIVQELQGGEKRAEYGKLVIEELSTRLTQRYGQGFSPTTLQYFRKFYLAYIERNAAIPRPMGAESSKAANERIIKSHKPEEMLTQGRTLPAPAATPTDVLKNPYVLEFLGMPNLAAYHESDLERAIITHLQRFLLELGSGFAFVARQKHIRIDEQDRYIDLVFYHCRLKFYLLIDLKVGALTHGNVGQMDGYVRMYDGLFTAPDDNPTIGLILCTEKSETVARYSVLNDRKQIFASKYVLCLPTEEQLRLEIERERHLIESALEDRK